MKIIPIKSQSKTYIKNIAKEITILKELDHPNILKVYECFTHKKNIFIINELCTGGELFDKIIEVKNLTEKVAAVIMRQLLSAVAFCHSHGVIHRDLKPENILIETQQEKNNEYFHIKVIDFGTCEMLQRNKMLKEQIGTSFYIAPEVLTNSYNEKCDLWSCGVILYILLCGSPPFYGACEEEIFNKIISCDYSFTQSVWMNISKEAKSLIKQLLELDPHKRLNAKDALLHPWFTLVDSNHCIEKSVNPESLNSVIKNMIEFRAEQKLQQAALAFLVHNLSSQQEVSEIKDVFMLFDQNGDGRLSKDELLTGITKITTERKIINDFDILIDTMDTDKNGFIEFEEFVRASIDKEKLLTEKNLKLAFDRFDKDKSGGISSNELKCILGGSNLQTKDIVWKSIIQEIDENGDGQISFEEFKNMMNTVILKNQIDI
jgi:calcium-dependent protein kinase